MAKLLKVKYWVWQTSLFGASLIAFGLGVLSAGKFSNNVAWVVIIIGILLHGYGMSKMYNKNNNGTR